MAQWNQSDRTLHAKVVYYGPAFGGKTTNLESLHRLTDPRRQNELLSIKTADDRTLFFDLLPFDLGEILGYQVALKLYTVPGQVRYDATRQVVLAGADAVVFVADSSADREEQNRWSLQNLQMNMRAKALDPAAVPVVFQLNKQDLEVALAPEVVARWLRVDPEQAFPAVATRGHGVLETFVAACKAMLQRLARLDERRQFDPRELEEHIDRAFAPHLARVGEGGEPQLSPPATPPALSGSAIVADEGELLQSAVSTGVELGSRLSSASSRAGRLEREAEALRRLADSLLRVGANFDHGAVIDATLETAAEALESAAVSYVEVGRDSETWRRRTWGRPEDPLYGFPDGRALLERLVRSKCPGVIEELAAECGAAAVGDQLHGVRAVAALPLGVKPPAALICYAPQPDGRFGPSDVRFLATLGSHLRVGLEKVAMHQEIERHRSHLEQLVATRTAQLRQAYEDLRGLERAKDRFLNNVSHEMKTPLTAILSAGVFLRDYDGDAEQRGELSRTIVQAGDTLRRLLDELLRLADLEESEELEIVTAEPGDLVHEALQLSGHDSVECRVDDRVGTLACDLPRLARAVANLVDNAAKFSAEGSAVELEVVADADGGLRISVLDRGPGVTEGEKKRIFAPFEQGGDPLTQKPRGVGLGLYEARAIVRRHGGRLDCHPRQGGGSEFRICLPRRGTSASARATGG